MNKQLCRWLASLQNDATPSIDECVENLCEVLPNLNRLKYTEQDPEWHRKELEHYETNDAYIHTKLALEKLEHRTTVNAWACLLHDIGKATTTELGDDGRIHAIGHHKVGADLAQTIVERLKFPSKEADQIVRTVYDHMKPMHVKDMKRSTLRRFLALNHIECILAVHRADCLASNGDLSNIDYIETAWEEFKNEPLIPKPLITGADLLSRGVKPGPIYGKVLRQLQTMQLEGTVKTEAQAFFQLGILLAQEEGDD